MYRVSCGLSKDPTDINQPNPAPSLKFIDNPEVNSRSELIEKRRLQQLKELINAKERCGQHYDASQRLIAREEAFARKSYKVTE